MLSIDTNRVGDARYFNLANGPGRHRNHQCLLWRLRRRGLRINNGARITDYASNGLDSGYSLCGGVACPTAAFPGINPNVGANQMLSPIGRSVYNGLQTSLRQDVRNPLPGVHYLNLQVSYAFSRYVSTARDNDFINYPTDNAESHTLHRAEWPGSHPSTVLRRHHGYPGSPSA